MGISNPITRDDRQSDVITATADQTVFAVSDFKIWDTADVTVMRRLSGADWAEMTAGFAIAKNSAATFDHFTVTLDAGAAAGTKFRFIGARTHERLQDVTAGGAISSAALERELDRQATIAQEIRRDLDKRPEYDPEGETLDLESRRIKNLAPGTADTDAVTKKQMEDAYGSEYADIAEEWAEKAEDSEITGHPGQYSAKHHALKAADTAAEFSRYPIGINLRTEDGRPVLAATHNVEPALSRPVKATFFYGLIKGGSSGGQCDVTFKVGATVKYGPITLTFDGGAVTNASLNIEFAADDAVDVQISNVSGDVQHVQAKLDQTYAEDPALLYGDFYADGSQAATGDFDMDGNSLVNVDEVNGTAFADLVAAVAAALTADDIGNSVQAQLDPIDLEDWEAGTSEVESTSSPAKVLALLQAREAPQSAIPDAIIYDQKNSGTEGGTLASGAWTTRALNQKYDPAGIISLAGSNEFVATKDGWVEIESPVFGVNQARVRLYNVTDETVDSVIIPSDYASNSNSGHARLKTWGPIINGKNYRVEVRCVQSKADNGLGVASGISGLVEIYTTVRFWEAHQQ